jgi:hypothetical protein
MKSKQTIPDIFQDIQNLTLDQLELQYNIEIYEDGVVYDPFEELEFETLLAWAQHIHAQTIQDNLSHQKSNSRHKFDDEY